MVVTTTLLFNSPPFVPKALNPCATQDVVVIIAMSVPQTSTAAMVLIARSAQRGKNLPQDLNPALTVHQAATKVKTLLRQKPHALCGQSVLLARSKT